MFVGKLTVLTATVDAGLALRDHGHSALDTHDLATLRVAHAFASGGHRRLPALADRIGALPRVGTSRMIRARLAVDLR